MRMAVWFDGFLKFNMWKMFITTSTQKKICRQGSWFMMSETFMMFEINLLIHSFRLKLSSQYICKESWQWSWTLTINKIKRSLFNCTYMKSSINLMIETGAFIVVKHVWFNPELWPWPIDLFKTKINGNLWFPVWSVIQLWSLNTID